MTVDRIAVTLGQDQTKIVGYGIIEHGGDLVIRIPGGNLVNEIEALVTVDQVRSLAVGVGYVAAKVKTYACPRCDKEFPEMVLMEAHVVTAHPEMEGWDGR